MYLIKTIEKNSKEFQSTRNKLKKVEKKKKGFLTIRKERKKGNYKSSYFKRFQGS